MDIDGVLKLFESAKMGIEIGKTLMGDDRHVKRTYTNGMRYEGETRKGKWHGKGTVIMPDGTKYEGEFRENCPHGRGKIITPTNQKYEMEFSNGKLYAQGVAHFMAQEVRELCIKFLQQELSEALSPDGISTTTENITKNLVNEFVKKNMRPYGENMSQIVYAHLNEVIFTGKQQVADGHLLIKEILKKQVKQYLVENAPSDYVNQSWIDDIALEVLVQYLQSDTNLNQKHIEEYLRGKFSQLIEIYMSYEREAIIQSMPPSLQVKIRTYREQMDDPNIPISEKEVMRGVCEELFMRYANNYWATRGK